LEEYFNFHHRRPVNFLSVMPAQAGIQKVVETTRFRPAPQEYFVTSFGRARMTGEVAENSCLNFSNHTPGHANQLIPTGQVFVNGTAVNFHIFNHWNYSDGVRAITTLYGGCHTHRHILVVAL
jgi:hypothetical protein